MAFKRPASPLVVVDDDEEDDAMQMAIRASMESHQRELERKAARAAGDSLGMRRKHVAPGGASSVYYDDDNDDDVVMVGDWRSDQEDDAPLAAAAAAAAAGPGVEDVVDVALLPPTGGLFVDARYTMGIPPIIENGANHCFNIAFLLSLSRLPSFVQRVMELSPMPPVNTVRNWRTLFEAFLRQNHEQAYSTPLIVRDSVQFHQIYTVQIQQDLLDKKNNFGATIDPTELLAFLVSKPTFGPLQDLFGTFATETKTYRAFGCPDDPAMLAAGTKLYQEFCVPRNQHPVTSAPIVQTSIICLIQSFNLTDDMREQARDKADCEADTFAQQSPVTTRDLFKRFFLTQFNPVDTLDGHVFPPNMIQCKTSRVVVGPPGRIIAFSITRAVPGMYGGRESTRQIVPDLQLEVPWIDGVTRAGRVARYALVAVICYSMGELRQSGGDWQATGGHYWMYCPRLDADSPTLLYGGDGGPVTWYYRNDGTRMGELTQAWMDKHQSDYYTSSRQLFYHLIEDGSMAAA